MKNEELFLPISVVGEDTGEYIIDAKVKKRRSKLINDAFTLFGKARLKALWTLKNEYGLTTLGRRVDGCLKVIDIDKELLNY